MRSVFAASALCAVLSTVAAPSLADQITVYGNARSYTIAQPAAKGPQPTIIMLHDAKGTGAAIAQSTKLGTLAPQQGFVAVFPDGQRQQWNFFPPGKEPDFFVKASKASGGIPDDGAFLKSLIDDLIRRGIADPRRVYIAGESNGGLMALRMLCTDANLFAGAALLGTAMSETLGANCHPLRPVPVLLIKGTKDDVLPYGGGLVEPEETFRIWSADRLIGFLQQLNGQSGPPQSSLLPRKVPNVVAIDRWTTCPGTPLTVYRIVDGPHIAPADLNEGQVVLDFFAAPAAGNSCVASLPPGSSAGPNASPNAGQGAGSNAGSGAPSANPATDPQAGQNNPAGPGMNQPGGNQPGGTPGAGNDPGQGTNAPGTGNGPGTTQGAGNDPGQGTNTPGAGNGPGTGNGPTATTDPNAPGGGAGGPGGPGAPGGGPGDTAGLGPPSDPGNPGGDTAGLGPPPDPGTNTAGLGPPPDPGSPTGGLGPPPNPGGTTTALGPPPPDPPMPPIYIPIPNPPGPPPMPPTGNMCHPPSPPMPPTGNMCHPPGSNTGTNSGGTKPGGTTLAGLPPGPAGTGGASRNCGFAGDGKNGIKGQMYTGFSCSYANGKNTCTDCTGNNPCTADVGSVCTPRIAANPPPHTDVLKLQPSPLPPPTLPPPTLPPASIASTHTNNVCNPSKTHDSSPKKKEAPKSNNNSAANAAANAAATAATATAIMGLVGALGRHGGGGGGPIGHGGGGGGGGGHYNPCHHR
jgi:polyhydroxybutyrate depolymerase